MMMSVNETRRNQLIMTVNCLSSGGCLYVSFYFGNDVAFNQDIDLGRDRVTGIIVDQDCSSLKEN